ncbi:MAG: DUF177 domain-containing protein [Negativicutes bacterium]|nr:DUF177 domain-containing protein [Negativicutes bacterium]
MKIAVAKIRETLGAELEFSWQVPKKLLDVSYCGCKLCGGVEVTGKLVNGGDEIAMTAEAELTAEYECSRCLEPVRVELKIPIFESYTRDRIEGRSWFDGDTVDIGEAVCQTVVLGVPVRALCREECRGLCPGCGVSLNEVPCKCRDETGDERWQALSGFRAERES